MKWLVVAGFLLSLACDTQAGALRCTPESEDASCSPDVNVKDLNKSGVLLAGKECLPGTQWVSQCNQCTCTDDGTASCTEKLCSGQENERLMRCLPNTMWKNECNTCWCTSTGRAMCTRIGCGVHLVTNFNPAGETPIKEDQENISVPDVEIDVEYLLDEDFEDHGVEKRSVCEPNETFEVECNSCKCDPNGRSYTCTQSECLEMDMDKEVEVFKESEGADHVERHTVCKPRATFHVGCNTCDCNAAGTDFTCATKPCALLNDVELFHEIKALRSSTNKTKAVVCAANRMFVKDCNTCWCNEDGTGYFCTRKVCVPELPDDVNTEESEQELRVIKRKCRPDEVFEMDCNMCRCNPDGKSFSCTRRACVPEEDGKNSSLVRKTRATSQETPKACQPGQEFRLDCNKCLCDNKGITFSCTRIDCAAINNNNNGGTRRKRGVTTQPMECTPGAVLQQGCKVCRCEADGRSAVCPTHCQHQKKPTENDISDTDSDPSFRCNPGEQFKRSCKDCTCSADGRSFFCTVRLCEEEITPTL